MKFGPCPVPEAEGAILAHSLALPGGRLRKGRLLERDDLRAIAAAGIGEVTVARLEPGDLHEDAAAAALGAALIGEGGQGLLRASAPGAGRVNLYARAPGVVELDEAALRALNSVDPMISFACVHPYAQTAPGSMVGTVKIISYAVAADALARAAAIARSGARGGARNGAQGALRIRPVVLRDADLVVTRSGPHTVPDKGIAAVRGRLEALGMTLRDLREVAHQTGAIAGALAAGRADLQLILTASATSDARDAAPEGLRAAGGRLLRFGMPVDPGNLLFLGEIGARPVIGLPGCARSPQLNGADYVLSRVAAGMALEDADFAQMAIGGLLKEIPLRGRLRES